MNRPTAIITGAGRGIGRATAVELSRRGWAVALVSRSADELNATAKLCEESLVAAADVSRFESLEGVVKATLDRFGRIDAIVNNAGLAPLKPFQEMSNDEWRATIDTNLSSVFYLSKLVWPVFAKQSSGVIVSISSLAARDPMDGFAAYGAAKAGINVFSQALAKEGAKIGVRVHVVAPGATETTMFRGLFSEQQFANDRTMRPEDVAGVVAGCITGELRHASGEVIWLHKIT